MLNPGSQSLLKLTLLCLSLAGVSQADILYSALPNQSGGSDLDSFLEADDFTLASSVRIAGVKFWALQGGAADYTGSIAWSINSNAGGVPGASLFSGSASPTGTSTGMSAFGLGEFAYTIPIDALLNPGTYWVVLHNGPNGAAPDGSFYWEWSNGNGGNSQSQDVFSPGWVGNFAELAFQVSSVPEPTSMLLLATGLLALKWIRLRTR